MNRIAIGALWLAMCCACWTGSARGQQALPEALRGWEAWVLDGQEFRRCPIIAGRAGVAAEDFVCAWPGRLELVLDQAGGRFGQSWQVVAESWIALPGDLRTWPADVTVDGATAAVVAREGRPMLRLAPGRHAIAGSLRWDRPPEALPVPREAALIALRRDGQQVDFPLLEQGRLWLGARQQAAEPRTLDLQVYRLLEDSVPARLQTRMRLRVGGDAREETLGLPLPEGFVAMALDSPLNARLDPDGGLRVQLRAGTWEIVHHARGADVAQALSLPAPTATWPAEEVWSFAAEDRLRVAAIEGLDPINPDQAQVPADWRELPAYRMTPGASLRVVERSRGLPPDNDNALRLERQVWLDFDHGGYTIVDRITGSMQDNWRLDMAEPYRLQAARIGAEPLLVTRADAARTGVELRSAQVDLTTSARLEPARGAHAASGWSERLQSAAGTLNLPPGHRLLAVPGAEQAPDAWLNRWDLLDIFLVLITAAAIARLLGLAWGVLAGAALVLSFQEPFAANWLWINAVIAIALARLAGATTWRVATGAYRAFAVLALLIWFVPFGVNQLRLALYPQLEAGTAAPFAPGFAEMEADLAAVPAPAADAVLERQLAGAAQTSSKQAEIVVTAASVSGQRYAPGTLVQAGPAVPSWRYLQYRYGWNGPVAPDDEVRFLIVNRPLLSAWRVLGVALGALLLVALLRRSSVRLPGRPGGAGAALLLLAGGALSVPDAALAQAPDSALLAELRARLIRPPQCAPTCAEIRRADVATGADSLAVALTVDALHDVAVAVPVAPGRWQIAQLQLDGRAQDTLLRDPEGRHWVELPAGVHRILMQGPLLAADSVQLVFPQVPRAIAVAGSGWDAAGIDGERLLTDTLELVRRQAAAGAPAVDVSAQLPPFVRVTRHIDLGLDWSVTTEVERLAPSRGAFTLEIPVLPGEAVLDAALSVRDGALIASFAAEQRVLRWNSALPVTDVLQLAYGANPPWSEVWRVAVGDTWNARFAGLPPVLPADGGLAWRHEFHPRSGETLQLTVTRPEAVPGTSLAIDAVELRASIGHRAANHRLTFGYRSTQGGRHVVRLPADARVTSVRVDGEALAIRPDQGELALAMLPGEHQVAIDWEAESGVATRVRTPAVDMGAAAGNIALDIALPEDRWLLFAGRGGVAPAVLYWGELLVFLVLAVLVGRLASSPLKTHEWLLLGLGLSTFAWLTLAVFAAWAFAMRWRERWHGERSLFQHRLVQVGLALLTVIAIGGLVSAIPNGLLAQPDMSVRGAGSWAQQLHWFFDRSAGALPQASAVSVSLWWYKAAMLAWALWLAMALMRWLPWAWRAFNAGGAWQVPARGA